MHNPVVISGYRRVGQVGDLKIQHLLELQKKGRSRIVVIGYLNTDGRPHHLDAEDCQIGLYGLVRMELT
jgi:hypothetical protein